MLSSFNSLVLMIASIILIILLIVIGIIMYYSAKNADFPPVIAECPDYWNVTKEDNKTICKNVLKVNPHSVSDMDSCNKIDPINFKGPTDKETVCNQFKWAKGCGVIWDGVTNNNESCIR